MQPFHLGFSVTGLEESRRFYPGPCDNTVEFKSFRDFEQLFAK